MAITWPIAGQFDCGRLIVHNMANVAIRHMMTGK